MLKKNKRRKFVFLAMSSVLFFLFSVTEISADDEEIYNCTDYYGASGLCQDKGIPYEFTLGYYTCNGLGACTDQSQQLLIGCEILDFDPDTGAHQCLQTYNPSKKKGYLKYDDCTHFCSIPKRYNRNASCYTDSPCNGEGRCLGPQYYCDLSTSPSRCCQIGGTYCDADAGCEKNYDCRGYGETYYDCYPVYRDSEDGEFIGKGKCCGNRDDGGGGDCGPQCPPPLCTVTHNDCKEANKLSDPTEYILYQATGQGGHLCKGNDAHCKQMDNCGNQNICATSSCYKPETNNTPAGSIATPTHITIGIGPSDNTKWYRLSTNRWTPTKIPVVPIGTRVRIYVPGATQPCPDTAGGCGALFTGTNFPSGWQTNNVGKNGFNPENLTTFLSQLAVSGTTGNIRAKHYLKNKCDDEKVIGTGVQYGYYKICSPDCPTPACTVKDSDCGEGFTGTNTGPYCKAHTATCSNTTDCETEEICNTGQCYEIETNQAPPEPTSIRIYEKIGEQEWTTYNSLSSTRRTLVRHPFPSSEIRTEINNLTLPSGARGLRLTLNGHKRVLNTHNPFNTFVGVPSHATLRIGGQGTLSAFFETLNKCKDTWVKGNTRKADFQANTPPVVTNTTVTGNTEKTAQGCTPETRHTGNEANRILTFRITARDVDTYLAGPEDDANHRMNAAVLWLVKEGGTLSSEINSPKRLERDATISDPNKIGIMAHTNGRIYNANNGGGSFSSWGREPDIYINVDNKRKKIATVSSTIIRNAQTGNDTTEIEIQITFEKNIPLSGKYNIWTGMMDNLTLFPVNSGRTYVDQRSVKSTGQAWYFDFENPTLKNVSLNPVNDTDQRNLILKWTSEDNLGIPNNHTVVNVYKTGQTPASMVRREPPLSPDPLIPATEVPDSENIGLLLPLASGWIHPNSGNTQMIANIMENAEGNLHFFITVYDKACNHIKTGEDGTPHLDPVELNKWIATKGGIFYSEGTVNYPTKSLDQYFNLGTELISSSSNSIQMVLNHSTKQYMNPAVAKNIIDINNSVGLFDALKENFLTISTRLSSATLTPDHGRLTCTDPRGCIFVTSSDLGGFIYNGNIIVVPVIDGGNIAMDITINKDIKAEDSNSALFVFTEGTVNIGGHATTTPEKGLHTDTIDAFILAKKGINILPEADAGDFHDKIVVNGGLIAFGDRISSGPAFSLRRTLGLYNISAPVLTVNYHPKYAVASELFFGLQTNAYKREVGFKPM